MRKPTVDVQPGIIRLSSITLAITTKNMDFWEIGCQSKYPSLEGFGSTMVWIGANERTLGTHETLETYTGVTFGGYEEGNDYQWMTIGDTGRYSIWVAVVNLAVVKQRLLWQSED